MRIYKSHMTKQTKLKLGVSQILNDGAIVEAMESDIKPNSQLPFEGRILASYFASYLTTREAGYMANYYGLISSYLLKWEHEGIVKSELPDNKKVYFEFNDQKSPTMGIELELYDLLKTNRLTGIIKEDYELLQNWIKKTLALGEQELLATSEVAFDAKGRVRFTKKGYEASLLQAGFEKNFLNLSLTTFKKQETEHQKQTLIFALLLDFTEEIENFTNSNEEVPEIIQIANRVWRF